MYLGDWLQLRIQWEFDTKMVLWHMDITVFVLCLCTEQSTGMQTYLCLSWGTHEVFSKVLLQPLPSFARQNTQLLALVELLIQSYQKNCWKQESIEFYGSVGLVLLNLMYYYWWITSGRERINFSSSFSLRSRPINNT